MWHLLIFVVRIVFRIGHNFQDQSSVHLNDRSSNNNRRCGHAGFLCPPFCLPQVIRHCSKTPPYSQVAVPYEAREILMAARLDRSLRKVSSTSLKLSPQCFLFGGAINRWINFCFTVFFWPRVYHVCMAQAWHMAHGTSGTGRLTFLFTWSDHWSVVDAWLIITTILPRLSQVSTMLRG